MLPTEKYAVNLSRWSADCAEIEHWDNFIRANGGVLIGVQPKLPLAFDGMSDAIGVPLLCFRKVGDKKMLSIPVDRLSEQAVREALGHPQPKEPSLNIEQQVRKAVAVILRKLAEELDHES